MDGTFVGGGFREVVAVRFAVGYREGDECVMSSLLDIDAGFRVEKIPVFIDVDVITGFVVATLNGIMDATVL